MPDAINFNNENLDDPLMPDGVPEFSGGQFSNWRANLLKANQSKELTNCDVDKLGRLRTRRGTVRIGSGTAGTGTMIQGLTYFQTKDYNYIVAANGGLLWKYEAGAWTRIALGGTVDNEDILIFRVGAINLAAGYPMGTTTFVVDNVGGAAPAAGGGRVEVGEKLYFVSNIRTEPWEYVITAVTPAAPSAANVTAITIEEPGLVFDVKDNWAFVVGRPAKINNGAGYPAGHAGAMTIDGYTGVVNIGEVFVIVSENVTHTVTAVAPAAPTTTTAITAAGTPLQADWAASDSSVPVVFAQGNDSLYFCDGVGFIYGWNGKTLMNLSNISILDALAGNWYGTAGRTLPPTTAKVLVWFQNRLIASGIPTEPDAIYFSDFLDPTGWDKDYQMLRIGGGDSDPITGLVPWTDLNMLVLKKNSIWGINLDPSQNPNPDDPTLLVASFSVKRIHRRIGCPAPLTAIQAGGESSSPGSDVFFVDGDKKVRSVRRVMAAETQQEIGDALSLPIQDFIDTTNLTWISRCAGFYHNDHYILAYPSAGATRPDSVAAYNLLTQSWCGRWTGWVPTCFAMRQDLGDYARMIYGDSLGYVNQWLDDIALEDEVAASYQDNAVDIPTQILTRAITFGDPFAYKTGLYAEFEFDESVADVTIQVILDKVVQTEIIAPPFSTLSELPLHLPLVLPFTLPGTPSMVPKAFDLQRYGSWRELQFRISSTSQKLSIRSIRVGGFIDTVTLQTLPPPAPVIDYVTVGGGSDPMELVTGDDTGIVTVE